MGERYWLSRYKLSLRRRRMQAQNSNQPDKTGNWSRPLICAGYVPKWHATEGPGGRPGRGAPPSILAETAQRQSKQAPLRKVGGAPGPASQRMAHHLTPRQYQRGLFECIKRAGTYTGVKIVPTYIPILKIWKINLKIHLCHINS